MGELRYEIDQKAYIKLVLHAMKHRSSAGNDVVEISDSVPLFHSHIGLLPQLEISLILIEECYASKGLSIVWYLNANERSADCELSGVAKNTDSKKLGALEKAKDRSPVMQLYTKDASKNWKPNGSDGGYYLATKEPLANVVLLDYISNEKWHDVVDFDYHLDDISKDWLNPELFK